MPIEERIFARSSSTRSNCEIIGMPVLPPMMPSVLCTNSFCSASLDRERI